MLSATFCLSPRGDTSSSKRTYESIAAGCIPVIIADDLRLPFARRLQWDTFSVRVSLIYYSVVVLYSVLGCLGCIPVIIADDLRLPFARRLHWDTFSVRVSFI